MLIRLFLIGAYIFLLHFNVVISQPRKIMNLASFDNKPYHFGFLLGFNVADFGIDYSYENAPEVIAVRNVLSGGFHLGTIGALKFRPVFRMYLIPQFVLTERKILYEISDTVNGKPLVKVWEKSVESSYITIALNFKYRSDRLNNFAAFMVFGGNYSIDLASQRKVDNSINPPEEQIVLVKRNNFYGEVGLGVEFFFQYFKFGIEYKFAFSPFNIFVKDNTIFAAPIDKLRPKLHFFSLLFEG